MDRVAASTAAGQAVADLDPSVRAFAAGILGVPVDDVVPWLADHIRSQGWDTQLRVLARAAGYADDAGIHAGPVPLKVLSPMLEAVALEEDPDRAGDDWTERRWAALLANAADADGLDVPPSFPAVLRELSHLEAEALAVIADAAADDGAAGVRADLLLDVLQLPAGESEERLALALENLYRLRLARSQPYGSRTAIWPTVFGLALARACRPPGDRR
jgi:hypothetical protein